MQADRRQNAVRPYSKQGEAESAYGCAHHRRQHGDPAPARTGPQSTVNGVVRYSARLGVPPLPQDIVPAAAERAIRSALDADPDRRPATPQAFATMLSAALDTDR